MKNSLNKIFVVVFSMLSILVTSFPFSNVMALELEDIYLMPFDKPVLDEDDVMVYTLQTNSNGGKYVHCYYLPIDIFVNGEPGTKPNKEHITNIIHLYSGSFRHYATSFTTATLYCNPIRYSNTGNYYDMQLVSGTNSFDFTHNIAGTLVGYQVYGDCDNIVLNGSPTFSSGDYDFTVLWGGDAALYQLMIENYNLTTDEKLLLADMLSKLGEIDSNTDNLEAYIKDVYNKLVEVDNNTDSVERYMENLYSLIDNVKTLVQNIDSNVITIRDDLKKVYGAVDEIEIKLDKLIDIFESEGSSNPDVSLDESSKDEYDNLEDELIGNDVDNDSFESIKIQYSSNALAVVFDIMNSVVLANQKVFTMIISILSIGIIALILGR